MPITFNCPCGKALRIADENAGKRVKCPACQAVGTAPAAAPKFELVEDDEPPARPAPAKPKSVAKAAVEEDAGFTVEDDEDEKPKSKKKPVPVKSSRRDEDDEDDDRPKKKKKPRRDDEDEDERPRRRKSADPDTGKKIAHVVGGLIVLLVGVVIAFLWHQNGPHTGRRPHSGYILGACLAVAGVIAAIKGITGNFDEIE